jgi:hypothetical protein
MANDLTELADAELDVVCGGISQVATGNLVNVQANLSNIANNTLNNNHVSVAVGVLSTGVGAFS